MAALMRFPRNVEIFGEEEAAEYVYQVVSGAVRTYRTLEDGRRQIVAFHLPGDIFGWEMSDSHQCSAEAIAASQVLVAKRSTVLARAECEAGLSGQLWMSLARELQRVQRHSMILIKSAEERLAGFLLEMSRRSCGAAIIELPMSRQDIADYLGLALETASRAISRFAQTGAISLESSRRIRLVDRTLLRQLEGECVH